MFREPCPHGSGIGSIPDQRDQQLVPGLELVKGFAVVLLQLVAPGVVKMPYSPQTMGNASAVEGVCRMHSLIEIAGLTVKTCRDIFILSVTQRGVKDAEAKKLLGKHLFRFD